MTLTLSEWIEGWTNAEGHRGNQFVYHLRGASRGEELGGPTIYVGVTGDLATRMRAHSRKWWWRAVDLDASEISAFPDRATAMYYEAWYIREYCPPMNRVGRLASVLPLVGPQ